MSKTNKIVIILAIILIIIFGAILINKDNDTQNNTHVIQTQTQAVNPISTKKTNGTFEIYNTDIKTSTGSTKLTANIKNISGSKTERQRVEIILIDKNGNELGTINTTVPSLEVNATTQITTEDLKVYENIYDFKIR